MQETIKRGDTRLAVKAGAWYVVSSFLVKGMAFITTPIFSRIMTKTAYGEFSNFASWLATLLIIASAELYNTISRAYYDYTEDFDSYVSTVTIASCGITALMYILTLIFKDAVLSIISLPEKYIHILFATLLCQCCKQAFMARERTLYRYKSVAAMSFVNLLIPTVVAVILVIFLPEEQQLSGRIYGFYLPSCVIGLACGVALLGRAKKFRIDQCKYAFKLSLPLLAHYLTAYVLTSSNTIVTKRVLGATASAVVSISSSTIHILTIFFQSLSGAINTWLMDNLKQKNYNKIRRDSLFYVAGLASVSIGVILVAPEVVWILGGTKYRESLSLIPGQVIAVLIQSVTSIFTIILTYDKNITKTAIITGVVATLNIMAKLMILPSFGVQALPYINIVSFAVLFVANYFLVSAAGYARAVNLKVIVSILTGAFAVMMLSEPLYKYNAIRYSLIALCAVVIGIVLYKYRNTIKTLLQMRKRSRNSNKPKSEF